MAEENKINEGNKDQSDVVSKADYEKAIERARKFEGMSREYEVRLDKYKDVDPEKYHAILEDYDNLRKKQAQGDPQEIDRLIKEKEQEIDARYQKRFGSKVQELEEKTKTYEQQLKELQVTSVVMSQAGQFIQPSSIALLKPFVEKYCQYQDGEVVVLDDKGEVRYSTTNPRERMTVEEFLSEFAENYGIGVDKTRKGTMTSVGNQHGGNGRYSGISVDKFINMTPEERQKLPADVRAQLSDAYLGRRTKETRKNPLLGN
jgi:hypothetical protein